MTTVALARRNNGGPAASEESWAPVAYARAPLEQPADPYLHTQHQHQHQHRISMRSPAEAVASHTESGNAHAKGNSHNTGNADAWWQASRRGTSLGATPDPSAQQQEQQTTSAFMGSTSSSVWPEGPAPPEHGHTIRAVSAGGGGNPAPGKAYLQQQTFDVEDRFEIFSRRAAGFGGEQAGGEAAWRAAPGEPTSGGSPEGWSQQGGIDPATAGAGMPWSRQAGGGDLRQPESVSGPQRLHEMKEYFRRHPRVPPPQDESGDRHPYADATDFRTRQGGLVGHDGRRVNHVQDPGDGSGSGPGVSTTVGSRQLERMPWQEDADSYSASTQASATGDATADNPPAVGIVNPPPGESADSVGGTRNWDDATTTTAAAGATTVTSSASREVGGEFDPQADCKTVHPGQVPVGGSPSSWWRDVPESVVSTFPWDLQLPNPAPPLALPHGPTDIRGLSESSPATVPTGAPPSASAAPMSGGLRMAPEHSPMCRCESCRFGKAAAPVHQRHRLSDQLQHLNAFDMMDGSGSAGGSGRVGGLRTASEGVLMDPASRGTYGAMRWGVNPPSAANDAPWGLGLSGSLGNGSGAGGSLGVTSAPGGAGAVTGGGGGGAGGGTFPGGRKPLDNARRGNAPACDAFLPPAPYLSNSHGLVSTAHQRGGLLHSGTHLGAPDRFSRQDLKSMPLIRDEDDGMLGAFDERDFKNTRIVKREGGINLSGLGLTGDDASAGLRRVSSGGGSESGAASGGGGSRAQRGKKTPASSRRCRSEGCQSHPNFGIEGDRRALYCAKHKLAGMVNVKAPRCRHPTCTRNPVYGNPGDPRATFCLTHKAPLMVDVKNRCCQHPGCKHQPSFGMVGDRRANYCFAHKLPSHVNIRRARARATS